MMAQGFSSAPAAPDGPGAANHEAAAPAEAGKPARFSPDVVAGLSIVVLCLLAWAITATFDDISATLTSGMGPAAFPRLVLGVMVLLALWLALTASSRSQPECEPVHPMVYGTAGAIVAVMGALALFGIHGAVAASCIGMGRLWGERRWFLMAGIAVGLSVAIQLAFVRGFGIGLPRGILQMWLG